MPSLNCPKCDYPVSEHTGHGFTTPGYDWCDCDLTEAQALRASQRKAAADYLFSLIKMRCAYQKNGYKTGANIYISEILYTVKAYRAAGIMRGYILEMLERAK